MWREVGTCVLNEVRVSTTTSFLFLFQVRPGTLRWVGAEGDFSLSSIRHAWEVRIYIPLVSPKRASLHQNRNPALALGQLEDLRPVAVPRDLYTSDIPVFYREWEPRSQFSSGSDLCNGNAIGFLAVIAVLRGARGGEERVFDRLGNLVRFWGRLVGLGWGRCKEG